MDMSDKNEVEPENRKEDPMNFHQASISSDWRYGEINLADAAMDLSSMGNPMGMCKILMVSSSCPASMVDTFAPPHWDRPANLQSMGFYDVNVQNGATASNIAGVRRTDSATVMRNGIDTRLEMGWNPPSSVLKGGSFLPNPPGIPPHLLSQLPADSGFIERAARFSCLDSDSFQHTVNPFMGPEFMVHNARGGGMMQEAHGIFTNTNFNSAYGGKSQKHETNAREASVDVTFPAGYGVTERTALENERDDGQQKSHEVKEGIGGSESDEAEFSGGGQDDQSMLEGTYAKSSPNRIGMKKRKRNWQNADNDKAKKVPDQPGLGAKDTAEIRQKEDLPSATNNKTNGKHGKQCSQASDPLKEEYIHVRARRGQATNSHSLAERVRREKISERMKFLQDLVPSCSKVTGKAVMLDEIINYVQSLQRQVEFLSMKLATVNPLLDFNIEGFLAKDILKSRAGGSSAPGFPPDMPMTYPPFLSSQPGLTQSGLPGMGTMSDVLRRSINSQLTSIAGGGFEDPAQVPNVWNDELHNVVQMSFGTNALNARDVQEPLQQDHMKMKP